MRTLIFHELFECIARGLHTPFSGKSFPLRTPNCAAVEVRRAFSGALRRPHCAGPQQQASSVPGAHARCPSCCAPSSSCSSLSLLLCCCGCTGGAVCCFTGPLTAGGRPGPFPSSLRCCLAFSYCSSRLLQPSCLNACIPDGMLGTLLLARNIVLPLLPRDGTHIPIHCLPSIYNIN